MSIPEDLVMHTPSMNDQQKHFSLVAHTPNIKHANSIMFKRHLIEMHRAFPFISKKTRDYLGIATVISACLLTYILCNISYGWILLVLFTAPVSWFVYQFFFPDRVEDIAFNVFDIPRWISFIVKTQLPSPYYDKFVDNLNVQYQEMCKDIDKTDIDAKRMAADTVIDMINEELKTHQSGRYTIQFSYTFGC